VSAEDRSHSSAGPVMAKDSSGAPEDDNEAEVKRLEHCDLTLPCAQSHLQECSLLFDLPSYSIEEEGWL